ncbi:MAG: hypothetical protein WBG80_12590, partial [Bacteroidota bacterium]
GVLSLTNFLVGALFIHLATQEEYGLYVTLTTLTLLVAGFQNSVVNAPLTVLFPSIPESKRPSFVASLFFGHLFLVGALGLLLAPFLPRILEGVLGSPVHDSVGWLFLLAVLGYLARDFFRSLFYVRLRPGRSMTFSIAYAALMLGALLGFTYLHRLSAAGGMVAIGVAGAVSSLFFAGYFRDVWSASWEFRETFGQTWVYSKWALLGVLASWVQSNTYVYLSGLSGGMADIAEISAARLTMMPVILVIAGWGMYIRPVMSHANQEEGTSTVLRIVKTGTVVFSALIVAYTIVLVLAFPLIAPALLPPSYHGVGQFIPLWGLIALVNVFNTNFSTAFQSLRLFRSLAYIGIVAACVSVILTAALVLSTGPVGFLLALVVSNIVMASLCWVRLARIRKETSLPSQGEVNREN